MIITISTWSDTLYTFLLWIIKILNYNGDDVYPPACLSLSIHRCDTVCEHSILIVIFLPRLCISLILLFIVTLFSFSFISIIHILLIIIFKFKYINICLCLWTREKPVILRLKYKNWVISPFLGFFSIWGPSSVHNNLKPHSNYILTKIWNTSFDCRIQFWFKLELNLSSSTSHLK